MDLRKVSNFVQALKNFSFLNDIVQVTEGEKFDYSNPQIYKKTINVVLSEAPDKGPVAVSLCGTFDEDKEIKEIYAIEHGNNKRIGSYRSPEDLSKSLGDLISEAASVVNDSNFKSRGLLRSRVK